MKSFEIIYVTGLTVALIAWTINLKSFEIEKDKNGNYLEDKMNCKLEKFWNLRYLLKISTALSHEL